MLEAYTAAYGRFEPVWTLEIQSLREDWASRTSYNPNSGNPNRWWNNRRGLPDMPE